MGDAAGSGSGDRVTTQPRCMGCGAEGRTEAMHFCPTDAMWVCSACAVRFGLADPTPRCPRCHGAFGTGVATPADDVVAIGWGAR